MAVGEPGPHDGGPTPRRPGGDPHLVGHQEAGQQPDAELTEELLPGEPEVVALGAAPDRGEQFVHLVLGQPDPAVVHLQHLARDDVHHRRGIRFDQPTSGDRVDGVLQQLPHVDAGTGLEVAAEEVDDAPQINLKRALHQPSFRPRCGLPLPGRPARA